MKLAEARLFNKDNDESSKHPINFLFNPSQYTISKSNNWSGGGTDGPSKGENATGATKNSPEIVFAGGDAATLSMELFFDTWHASKSAGGTEDVRKYTSKVFELMFKEQGKKDDQNKNGRPPFVLFVWGNTHFEAAIVSVTQKFTMFLNDGTPVRATLEVVFKQRKDKSDLSDGNGYRNSSGTVVRVPGDTTVDAIAHRHLGSADMWRLIADRNPRIARVIKAGTEIVIPMVKDVQGVVKDAKSVVKGW